MPIDTRPRLAGVVGAPIAHSLSPSIHRFWLSCAGIPGGYVPLLVEDTDEEFEEKLAAFKSLGAMGVNITSPHKERALALASDASPAAKAVGAANMATFTADGYYADNSDVAGVAGPVSAIFGTRPIRSMILGAGGAARAAAYALKDYGPIAVANRTELRARTLAQDLEPATIVVVPWEDRAALEVDLVVNATNLGMHGRPPLDMRLDRVDPHGCVFDMVYSPLRTPLLEQASRKGLKTIDGLSMLIAQAAAGARAWFDIEPAPEDATRAMLVDAIRARG